MKRTEKDRLSAWLNAGMPADPKSLDEFEISLTDVRRLEKRLMKVLLERQVERTQMVFADHRTLQ